MSLPNESPPVITVARLQNELDSLMAQYEAFDQRRSQKSVEAAFGVLVLLIGGGALSSLAIMRGRAGMLLAVLTGVVLFGRSLYRYRKERRTTLATMDRSLSLLGPQLRLADRLNMRWEYRNKLHDRLFTGPIEVTAAIIPVLEVTGDKESLDFLWSLAGRGTYGHLLAPGLSPDVRHFAATAALSLQKKLDRETAAKTLLRASGSATENELLRPAGISGVVAPELLLRAETAGQDPRQEESQDVFLF